jgi:hypothetical protein
MIKKLLIAGLFVLLISINAFAAKAITFTWAPNQESDLAGYKLYTGNATGNYTANVDVGNVITHTLTLPDGNYYFALSAYDTSGNESGKSNEVSTVVDTTPPAAPGSLNITVQIIINNP